MQTRTLFLSAVALVAATPTFAQDYLDLSRIRGLPDTPAVQVDLNPMMLGLASAVSRTANPDAAAILANVDGVRVRVYSSLEDVDAVIQSIGELSAELTSEGWQQVVRVQDDADVRIYVQTDGQTISGLTAMIVADQEAVFVNVVGSLTAEQLAGFVNSVGAGGALASLGQLGIQQ
jgi:Domain of unknown function (DUF4252)